MTHLITIPPRCVYPFVLVLTLILSSCGGGNNTSGIGGTGITTVTGNVSQVITEAPQEEQALAGRMLAGAVNWLARPVNAESRPLGGIQVFAGGQVTTTDDDGRFTLVDVAPSDNLVLSFVFEDNQTVALPIGAVPPGSLVQVRNVIVDTAQGVATPEEVEIEEVVDTSDVGNGNNSGRNGNPDNPGQSGISNLTDTHSGVTGRGSKPS